MLLNHENRVARIQHQLREGFSEQKTIRLKRVSTNSTRTQPPQDKDSLVLDFLDFTEVIEVNPAQKWVDVEPGVTMEVLVAATLQVGLIPPVVPEFPGITAGGAVQGGALESSSHKFGQFNDTVREYELILANGEKIIATPDNEYSDVFWGISTSYGSLAIITRVRVNLIEAKKYVQISVTPYSSGSNCTKATIQAAKNNEGDFVEGLIFSENSAVVIVGKFSNEKGSYIARFTRNIDAWYYRFIKQIATGKPTLLTIPLIDYLFRYDKGAFWMGEHLFPLFHLSSNKVTRFLFAPFLRTRKLYDGLHALNIQHEYVIQDVYVSQKNIPLVLHFNAKQSQIYPLWICPIRASSMPQKLSSHFRSTEELLLNIGIYGKPKNNSAIETTRILESLVRTSGDRKMLYAQTFLSKHDFWVDYEYLWYENLRSKYRATTLRDIWEKIYSGGTRQEPHMFRGILRMVGETVRGKNVVWR